MALLIRSATGDIPVAEALIRDGQKDNGTCMNGVRKNVYADPILGISSSMFSYIGSHLRVEFSWLPEIELFNKHRSK